MLLCDTLGDKNGKLIGAVLELRDKNDRHFPAPELLWRSYKPLQRACESYRRHGRRYCLKQPNTEWNNSKWDEKPRHGG